jgi:hypothetical protein
MDGQSFSGKEILTSVNNNKSAEEKEQDYLGKQQTKMFCPGFLVQRSRGPLQRLQVSHPNEHDIMDLYIY